MSNGADGLTAPRADAVAAVALIGGSELSWLLALAADALGADIRLIGGEQHILDGRLPRPGAAGAVDPDALAADACDRVVTFPADGVPVALVRELERRGVPVRPGSRSLAAAQDALATRRLLERLRIPLADSPAPGRQLLLDVVRSIDGDVFFYPLAETLRCGRGPSLTRAPAPADPWLVASAQSYAADIVEELGHVGALTLRLDVVEGKALVRGIVPGAGVHGLWTVDGAITSQFENHVRAVLGLPLGATGARGASVLVPLFGTPPALQLLGVPGASVRLYGTALQPGGQTGHVSLVAADGDPAALHHRVLHVLALIERSTDAVSHHGFGQEARHLDPR